VEVSGTLAVGNGGTGAVSFTLVVYLEVIMLELSVASAADIVAAIGATFVTNATNATNATNTVNVGVNAATATPFLSWVSAASGNQPTKVSSANLSLFLLLVFYQDSQEMVCTNISYSSLIQSLCCSNSTFFIGTTAVALNRASANQALTEFYRLFSWIYFWYRNISTVSSWSDYTYYACNFWNIDYW
jgi:hypothetical protein